MPYGFLAVTISLFIMNTNINFLRLCLLYTSLGFMVACGSDDSANISSWSSIATLPFEFRTHHSYAFSLNEEGYIVGGGFQEKSLAKFYKYDLDNDQWISLGDYPGPPRSYGIGDVWSEKAYFGFGSNDDGFLNDLWVFDGSNLEWNELATCPCKPREHPALVANNGKLYMGLGNTVDSDLNDWWEYDIATDQWAKKSDYPGSPRHHPFQFSLGNYVYVAFGHGVRIYNDLYRYDPQTDTWVRMADLPGEGRVAGTQFSFNGKGYVLSGDGEGHTSMDQGEFWSYDPQSNSWEQLESHPEKSRWAPASFVLDDEVYLLNGIGDSFRLSEEIMNYKFSLR